MLVSRKILSQYVDLHDISDDQIAHTLTFAGIEVEDFAPLAVGSSLVIGQIKKVHAVAGSDHLHLLEVDLGDKFGTNQIICGAPNVKENAKVIVAREGAVLKDITIKKTTIHGHESNGMCCSLLELGVSEKYLSEDDIAGIALLDDDAVVGDEDVLAYLDLDDTVFDIKPLANRSDVLALFSLARELGALFEREVVIPQFEGIASKKAKVSVKTMSSKCPQFALKEIHDIKVGPSPKWLVNRLVALGQRSINNIVDIGNYVMLLTGQPLHMYDLDLLSSTEFSVRDDIETDFVGLDDKTYRLEKGDLVVMTGNEVVGIAGVLGGASSSVNDDTVNIAIEAAYFERSSIRTTSTRLNLTSEASQRFAKGINPHQTEDVLNFAASLVATVCGASDQSNIVNDDHLDHNQTIIELSTQYLNNLLGTEFSCETIVNTFERLYMRVTVRNEALFVVVPPWRIDITGKADLAEELIRVLGFYNVKSELPVLPSTAGGYSEMQSKNNDVRKFLQSRGLFETLTYTLVSQEEVDTFAYIHQGKAISLAHPMTPEHQFLRLNLLGSLLSVAQYNYARQQSNFGLFETSEVYSEEGQEKHLSIILVGDKSQRGLLVKRPYDFYDLKGLVESLFSLLDIKESRYSIEGFDLGGTEFHPGRSAKVLINKKVIAVFGELHPKVLNARNFNKTAVVGLELNLSAVFDLKVSMSRMSAISQYPSVSRDLSLVVGEEIAIKVIIDEIRKIDRKLIKDVQVFDIYRGEHLAAETKSVALKITYQDESKTLTDAEIKALEEKIKTMLDRKFAVRLRG